MPTTTVQPAPDSVRSVEDDRPTADVMRDKQTVALQTAIDLRGLDLPDVRFGADSDGSLTITVTRYDGTLDQTTADYEAWLAAVGITEYKATDDGDVVRMTATGTLGDIPVRAYAHVYGVRPAAATVRTVTL